MNIYIYNIYIISVSGIHLGMPQNKENPNSQDNFYPLKCKEGCFDDALKSSLQIWPMLKPSPLSPWNFLLSCVSSWFNRLPTIWQKNGDRICNIQFCNCNSAKSARRNSRSGRYRIIMHKILCVYQCDTNGKKDIS